MFGQFLHRELLTELTAYEAWEDQFLSRNWRNFAIETVVGTVTSLFVKFLLSLMLNEFTGSRKKHLDSTH